MLLRHAGYRERAFWKSWLAESAHHNANGAVTRADVEAVYARSLEGSPVEGVKPLEYDPTTDRIRSKLGQGIKVSREGSESRAILARLGYSDDNCHAAVVEA